MGLLDDDYVPPWTPPKSKQYQNQTPLSQQNRDEKLNNFDRPLINHNPDNHEYRKPSL